MEMQESGTGRVRFITRAFPRAFPLQWKAGLTCKLCDMGAKEDIIHFLFVCPLNLMHARNIFTSKMSSWINNFDNLSNTEKIHIILNFDATQTKAHSLWAR